MPTATFHGVPLEITTLEAAVDEFLARSMTGTEPEAYRLVNAYCIALASTTPDYLSLLKGPGVNLPDGKPVAAMLRRLRHVDAQQVRGPSFFEAALDRGRAHGTSHYFLGTTESTLSKLSNAVLQRYPGVEIAGTYSPPFGPMTDSARRLLYNDINRSGAHVVWVALGTPKQDHEARRLVDDTSVTAAAVGAAFDFSAGTKKTAPALVHRLGLEWLFRLLSEPRRLGRRYIVGNTVFLRLALREWRKNR